MSSSDAESGLVSSSCSKHVEQGGDLESCLHDSWLALSKEKVTTKLVSSTLTIAGKFSSDTWFDWGKILDAKQIYEYSIYRNCWSCYLHFVATLFYVI